jgi:hypothetical protein
MSVPARPTARRSRPAVAIPFLFALVAAGCAAAGPDGSPSPDGSAAPSAPPSVGEIAHATGPTDLLLQYEEGGGFVPIGFIVTQAPAFSLYGDGTVIVRDPSGGAPPGGDGIAREAAFRVARLDEELIQRVLDVAINRARLDIAAETYENPFVADASTAIFTVKAGGLDKRVEAYALGLEAEGLSDPEIRRLLAELAEDLRGFELGSGLEFEDWVPDRYRGSLLEDGAAGGGAPRPWPWETIQPEDFTVPGPDLFPNFPRRTLSAADVEQLAIVGLEGGAQNIQLTSPDGTVHTLALRPLLPNETS